MLVCWWYIHSIFRNVFIRSYRGDNKQMSDNLKLNFLTQIIVYLFSKFSGYSENSVRRRTL